MLDMDDKKAKNLAILRALTGTVSILIIAAVCFCFTLKNNFIDLVQVKVMLGVIAACFFTVLVLVITVDN